MYSRERNNGQYSCCCWYKLHKMRRLHSSLGPNSALRARFCSSNAWSSASSWASIAAPRLGLTSPCTSRGRPNASPKLPPDCLRKNQRGAGLSDPGIALIRKRHNSLYFQDLVQVHTFCRQMLGPFRVMFLTTVVRSTYHTCNWTKVVYLLLVVRLEHGRLASVSIRDRGS